MPCLPSSLPSWPVRERESAGKKLHTSPSLQACVQSHGRGGLGGPPDARHPMSEVCTNVQNLRATAKLIWALPSSHRACSRGAGKTWVIRDMQAPCWVFKVLFFCIQP